MNRVCNVVLFMMELFPDGQTRSERANRTRAPKHSSRPFSAALRIVPWIKVKGPPSSALDRDALCNVSQRPHHEKAQEKDGSFGAARGPPASRQSRAVKL